MSYRIVAWGKPKDAFTTVYETNIGISDNRSNRHLNFKKNMYKGIPGICKIDIYKNEDQKLIETWDRDNSGQWVQTFPSAQVIEPSKMTDGQEQEIKERIDNMLEDMWNWEDTDAPDTAKVIREYLNRDIPSFDTSNQK